MDTTAGDVEGVTRVVEVLAEVVARASWPADVSHEVTMLDARGMAVWRYPIAGSDAARWHYPPVAYTFIVAGVPGEARVTLGDSPVEVTLPAP